MSMTSIPTAMDRGVAGMEQVDAVEVYRLAMRKILPITQQDPAGFVNISRTTSARLRAGGLHARTMAIQRSVVLAQRGITV